MSTAVAPGVSPGEGGFGVVPSADEQLVPAGANGPPWRWWPGALSVGIYSLLALADFGRIGTISSQFMAGPRGADQIAQVWWIKWIEFAIVHGHNPMFTDWQNYPAGFNAGVNGSMLVPSILISPVTALLGPIVTWNVLLRLALVVSATAMCFVLRRWTCWWPAAFAGGLLYGFSVYQTDLAGQYLFLTFAPLPPLFLLLFHETLVRQRWKPARVGAVLGLLCGVQFFISSEVLASTAVMSAVGVTLYLLANRSGIAAKMPYLLAVVKYGAVVGGLVLICPVLFTLFGRQHISGAPNSAANLAKLHGDLLGSVIPTFYQSVSLSPQAWSYTSYLLYLGAPLILSCVCIVFVMRRQGIVAFCAAMAASSFVLSIGSYLYVGGHDTGIPLPFIVLAHLPIMQGLLSTRFSLFTGLFVAVIVAIGIDVLYRRVREGCRKRGASQYVAAGLAAGLCTAIMVGISTPLWPAHVQLVTPSRVSPFFSSRAAVQGIPPGGVVLTYPYPSTPNSRYFLSPSLWDAYQSINDPLVDQAAAGMYFKLIGGYGWRPQTGPNGSSDATPLLPRSVQSALNTAFYGFAQPGDVSAHSMSALTNDLRTFMRRYNVQTVVVLPLGAHPSEAAREIAAAIGSPTAGRGALAWYDVSKRLAVSRS